MAKDRFLALAIYHPNLRYSYILEYLPASLLELILTRHTNLAQAPNRYEALKTAICEYTRNPYWARMQTINTLPSVGTLTPIQLMCQILSFKGIGDLFNKMLQYMFLKRLPTTLCERYKNKALVLEDPMKFAVRVEKDWMPQMSGPAILAGPALGHNAAASTPASTVAQVSNGEETLEPSTRELVKILAGAIQTKRGGGNPRGRG